MTIYEKINFITAQRHFEYMLLEYDFWWRERFRDFYIGSEPSNGRPTENAALRNIYYEGLTYGS